MIRYRAFVPGDDDDPSRVKEIDCDTEAEALRLACRDIPAGMKPMGIWEEGRLLRSAADIAEHCSGRGGRGG